MAAFETLAVSLPCLSCRYRKKVFLLHHLAMPYLYGYNSAQYTVIRTDEFDEWLLKLRDAKGKARILARIRSAELGNLSDCEPVGDGISEMRIHYGPGYRAYFKRTGAMVLLLLLGGDKSSQHRDIKRAKTLAALLKE